MDVEISTAAEADLEDIALYIAQDSLTRALTITDELQAKARSSQERHSKVSSAIIWRPACACSLISITTSIIARSQT